MAPSKFGPETSHDHRVQHHHDAVYARKMFERLTFMQEHKEARIRYEKQLFNEVRRSVGPKWYQALSVPQRNALDTLEFSIYQDLLEGRPVRTAIVMKNLGLYPRPKTVDLMNCVYLGRDDPKEMLAQLFMMTYGHAIQGRRMKYCLKARLILSGIYYLGMDNLIKMLRERFRPVPVQEIPKTKLKRKKEPPLASPYLQKMVAVLYHRPVHERKRPAPLPPFDDEPEEDLPTPVIVKQSPAPPPPPQPPKKRLPRSYCDKIAGVISIEPYSTISTNPAKPVPRQTSHRRIRGSKLNLMDDKANFLSGSSKKKGKNGKPTAPSTGMKNAQYLINGVFKIRGKTVFVLSTICTLPAIGELIHGGYACVNGEHINVHCGYRAHVPPPNPDPCDCLKNWEDSVMKYVKDTKCYCGHYYDYGNEGTFLPEELPFFQKATRHYPIQFNYQTIFNLDEKHLHIEKDFKRIWETDSMLRVDNGTRVAKKRKRRSSTTCLGENPKSSDYLRCALRMMRRLNIAAYLPDIHLAPELKEWMRFRVHGPYTRHQKALMLDKSCAYWQMFKTRAAHGYGHVSTPEDQTYAGHTTWAHKMDLIQKFKKFTLCYKLKLFKSQAELTNLLWPTMCQAAFPDKKFREIYFSYLSACMEDMNLLHPYIAREAEERYNTMYKKRYRCPPIV